MISLQHEVESAFANQSREHLLRKVFFTTRHYWTKCLGDDPDVMKNGDWAFRTAVLKTAETEMLRNLSMIRAEIERIPEQQNGAS